MKDKEWENVRRVIQFIHANIENSSSMVCFMFMHWMSCKCIIMSVCVWCLAFHFIFYFLWVLFICALSLKTQHFWYGFSYCFISLSLSGDSCLGCLGWCIDITLYCLLFSLLVLRKWRYFWSVWTWNSEKRRWKYTYCWQVGYGLSFLRFNRTEPVIPLITNILHKKIDRKFLIFFFFINNADGYIDKTCWHFLKVKRYHLWLFNFWKYSQI